LRGRLEPSFERFLDVNALTDREVALLARDLDIDIAVDLGGFTEHARPGVFALRAAPLQVSYLGYLGTMGAGYMDYVIADPVLVRPSERAHYAEKILELPWYQVNDATRPVPGARRGRESLGLPPDGFVFCCFNTPYKILPETFDCWMRILARTPGSSLLLYVEGDGAQGRLRERCRRAGLDAHRIVFAGQQRYAEFLARLPTADLFLDTAPYNAGATASDALWCGLPVLTFPGATFAGRMGASLLRALEMPELIAADRADYENTAVRLASEPETLGRIRDKLAAQRTSASLFDTARFTQHLERGYRAIHERWRAGLAPEHVVVSRERSRD
jgi:predicted O-linked N-acetylglucosamine transferase (SPINDLY family)